MIKFTILALFVAAALAYPEKPAPGLQNPEPEYGPPDTLDTEYGPPVTPDTEYGPPGEGNSTTTRPGNEGDGYEGGEGGQSTPAPCEEGLIRDPLGDCVKPEVIRDLYVFQEPADEGSTDKPELPPPKVKLNLVVIKTDDGGEGDEPIIIPPPQEKTLVLVLSKKGDNERQIIEIPAPTGQKPEVFFVDYAEGDNPLLPGQIYLQDALKYAAGGQTDEDSEGAEGSDGSEGYTESAGSSGSAGSEGSSGTVGSTNEQPVQPVQPEVEPAYSPYYF